MDKNLTYRLVWSKNCCPNRRSLVQTSTFNQPNSQLRVEIHVVWDWRLIGRSGRQPKWRIKGWIFSWWWCGDWWEAEIDEKLLIQQEIKLTLTGVECSENEKMLIIFIMIIKSNSMIQSLLFWELMSSYYIPFFRRDKRHQLNSEFWMQQATIMYHRATSHPAPTAILHSADSIYGHRSQNTNTTTIQNLGLGIKEPWTCTY